MASAAQAPFARHAVQNTIRSTRSFSRFWRSPSRSRHLSWKHYNQWRLSTHHHKVLSSTVNDEQANTAPEQPEEMPSEGADGRYKGKKAVVIGAGPSGSVAAAFLAKQGFDVKVYEKRSDPELSEAVTHRSIYIALQPATVQLLKRAGVDIPPEQGGYLNGLHRFYGGFQVKPDGRVVQGPPEEGFRVVGERHNIARNIISGVRQRYQERLEFIFDHECKSVSFQDKEITFADKEGNAMHEDYDLLVAADGTQSIVRDALEEFDKDFNVHIRRTSRTYKSIRSLSLPPPGSDMAEMLQPGTLIATATKVKKYEGKPSPPRVTFYLGEEGVAHAILTSDKVRFDNIAGKEEQWAQAAFPSYYPPEWKHEIASQVATGVLSTMAPITSVSKLTGPQTVLLGDASHSVTPALGIGCNLSIMDGEALNQALESANGDVDAAVQVYNDLRFEEIRNAQILQESVPGQGLRTTLFQIWWPIAGALHLALYSVGHQLLPKLIPTAAYFSYLRDKISSKQAVAIIRRDGFILLALLVSLILFMARRLIIRFGQYMIMKAPFILT